MTREEAIDVLKCNYPSSCFEELCKAVDIAIKALSAQPEMRWIPCSERLPEGEQEILFSTKHEIDALITLMTENGYKVVFEKGDRVSSKVTITRAGQEYITEGETE